MLHTVSWFLFLLFIALLFRGRTDPNAARRADVRSRAAALYNEATVKLTENPPPDSETFSTAVWRILEDKFGDSLPALDISHGAILAARALYKREAIGVIPPPPYAATELDHARYLDFASAQLAKATNPDALNTAQEAVTRSLFAFSQYLPPLAKRPLHALFDDAPQFRVSLTESMPKLGEAIQALMAPYFSEHAIELGLFKELRQQFERNIHEMSGVPFPPSQKAHPKLIMPPDAKGMPEEIVHGYLKDTPFEELLSAGVPFEIPEETRFEHHWIVAGSGHGKTQTLQYLIGRDLERVAKGEASVVVIDSQGDLIKTITGLKQFAPGGSLHDRICLIDPTDIEYPVALNLFDVGMERINQYSPLDRERLVNGVLELYDFVLGSLLSAELTQKQAVIFRYITRLMLHIPGATIHTFRELMEPNGYEKYHAHIDKLEGTARAFFETEFNSKQFEDTKRQVVRRLWGILENQTFERMFSHPKNKLDLFTEMNSGKVILINTAKELLKQNGTEIFGRFFIALIAQAAQERATLAGEDRLPTFVYIDECADYLDQNVSLILEQARKYKVGMILAHQYVGQLVPKLQDSFAANTSIKFAGGVSDKDARTLGHMLRCEPEFIDRQPKGHFAAAVRNLTASAVSLEIPFGYLEQMPRMEQTEVDTLREAMRGRYAVHWREIGGNDREECAQASSEPSFDIAPSPDW